MKLYPGMRVAVVSLNKREATVVSEYERGHHPNRIWTVKFSDNGAQWLDYEINLVAIPMTDLHTKVYAYLAKELG